MKQLHTILTISAVLMTASTAAHAFGYDDENAYDQCIIVSMQGTRSDVAAQIIQNSCRKLYTESTMMRDADKRVHLCLLQSLRGVDSDYAAQSIYAACGRRYGG